MKEFLLVLLLFSIQANFAQNYSKIDSIVKTYPKSFKSIKSFADRIESDFNTDLEKTRATYYWIANNIAYDYKTYKNGTQIYKRVSYKTEDEYQKKQLKQEVKYAKQCLKRKSAVCEGYSLLLKFTLESMGIPCEFISGFTKSSVKEIGRNRNIPDHAWNAVKINNEWKLIDVTWSTGNRELSPTEFYFDDTYFFTYPEKFILDHFPVKEKWQLLDKPMKKSDFFLLPRIFTPFFKTEIELGSASLGILEIKTNDTIKLIFKKVEMNKFYKYAFKNELSTQFLFEENNDEFIINIPYRFTRPKTLILYYEDKSILEYKVVLKN